MTFCFKSAARCSRWFWYCFCAAQQWRSVPLCEDGPSAAGATWTVDNAVAPVLPDILRQTWAHVMSSPPPRHNIKVVASTVRSDHRAIIASVSATSAHLKSSQKKVKTLSRPARRIARPSQQFRWLTIDVGYRSIQVLGSVLLNCQRMARPTFWHSIRAVSGAPLNSSGLEEALWK